MVAVVLDEPSDYRPFSCRKFSVAQCPRWVNRVVAGACRSAADFRNAPKADASQNIGICREGRGSDISDNGSFILP
jgi:hypothetical protein